MAYDEDLAERVRAMLDDVKGVAEIKMFGGLCFTVGGNMAVGVSHDDLLVRMSPDDGDAALTEPGVRLMEIGSRTSRGFLAVSPEATETNRKLHAWIDRGVAFAASLPPKQPKRKGPKGPRVDGSERGARLDSPSCASVPAAASRILTRRVSAWRARRRWPSRRASHEVRKSVTVVFCDVSGSTALGELLDPEALRRVMTRYFDTMKVAIEHHGGTVEKFIGDAVMAVFGIPNVHEDDALRAARAAVEMREGLLDLNKELERDHGVTLASRIGVNTGEVVAGDPTTGQALVTGDAVNTAARLEQAAAPGEILIGEETYRLTRDAVRAKPAEPIAAKGKSEPLSAYRLDDVMAGAAGHTRRLDAPMVGRDRELALLGQAFDRATTDHACHLFTVLGTAGAGKTRLVEEFAARVDANATVLRGRCLAYGEGITFWPVVELVGQAAGLSILDLPEDALGKLLAVIGPGERSQRVADLVACLVGLSETEAPVEESFWALRRFLEILASRSTAPAAPRRSPVGRADVPRSGGARRRVVSRRPDPDPRAGAARAA